MELDHQEAADHQNSFMSRTAKAKKPLDKQSLRDPI